MTTTLRKLRVQHTTRYVYDVDVQGSAHRLHLCPVHDWEQRVLAHTLTLRPQAPVLQFDDVFGNRVTTFELTAPYRELEIASDSIVELRPGDPFELAPKNRRPSFPLVWMPWEQAMLAPYLRPVELPDTQLTEIFEHGMAIVRENDGDLMETLFAINLMLFKQYAYAPGSTNLDTTPYDVFVNKRGVCQDFANLFICLARLLGIPARYVCGYVFTGNTGEGRAGSDASHAWVQLYLPNLGWRSFDPTNGVLPTTEHVRIGYGRYHRDVTPTSGTLYTPAQERMSVEVTVSEVT